MGTRGTPQQRARSQADLYQAMSQEERRREARRQRVAKVLVSQPEQRCTWDVDGGPPVGPAASDVSVLFAVRTAERGIIVGELRIPAASWDMGKWIAFREQMGKQQS